MTNPTPEEITAALTLLLSIPGINPSASLNEIYHVNTPHRRMAAKLHKWWTTSMPRDAADLETELRACAEQHGLHITTDLGEPIGFVKVVPSAIDSEWLAGGMLPSLSRLDGVAGRSAAVYLLPEGGQA